MGTERNHNRGPHDLIRADWYSRTVDIMSEATIAANRRDLVAQLAPGFVWATDPDSGTGPLTEAERADIEHCLVILDSETARRVVLRAQSVGIARKGVSAEKLDTESSASRQHYIDTGHYLRKGEALY